MECDVLDFGMLIAKASATFAQWATPLQMTKPSYAALLPHLLKCFTVRLPEISASQDSDSVCMISQQRVSAGLNL